MKILVTSDNHLGFKKKNQNWSRDAFHGLTEHLTYASDNDVDLVLFLGDIFDKKEPKIGELENCRIILEKTIRKKNWNFMKIGDKLKNVDWNLLETDRANYLRSNLHIVDLADKSSYLHEDQGIIAIGINGNHDRPNDEGICALGMLHQMGYVLHLEEAKPSRNELYIRPILFRKGDIHLAVYGLNAQKESFLNYMCREGLIEFEEPPKIRKSMEADNGFLYIYSNRTVEKEFERNERIGKFLNIAVENNRIRLDKRPDEDTIEWVTVLLVHQNKYRGEATTTFYPEILPKTFDFILWGNEHESIPYLLCPFDSLETVVLFPGSSVKVTTKIQESNPKHICRQRGSNCRRVGHR